MTNQIEQGSRLKTLLALIGISQVALSQRLGFTGGYISILVKGEKPMSQKFLNRLSESFPKVNINWLLKGQGEPLNDSYPGKTYQIEDGRIRTLEDMEYDNGDDPFAGLKDMHWRIGDLERRVDELEQKLSQITN